MRRPPVGISSAAIGSLETCWCVVGWLVGWLVSVHANCGCGVAWLAMHNAIPNSKRQSQTVLFPVAVAVAVAEGGTVLKGKICVFTRLQHFVPILKKWHKKRVVALVSFWSDVTQPNP